MSRCIIEIARLGKRYRLGRQQPYETLRDRVAEVAMRALLFGRHPSGVRPARGGEIWALKDLDLNVTEGEVLGIIGRNGSGKSTLLKILSRITLPTTGTARLRGRVASLLEVGTGFHAELTGRENIYVNGSMLSMSRAEIDAAFDSIVDFSGLAEFLDTPTKRYSSGMTVRLAFSVAAHLQPAILLVDEVLAVGDAEFQRRSIKRMQEIGQSGRTILFVSHQLEMVARLCGRAIWLEQGQLRDSGTPNEVIRRYFDWTMRFSSNDSLDNRRRKVGQAKIRIKDVWIETPQSQRADKVEAGDEITIAVEYEPVEPDYVARFVACRIGIVDNMDRLVCRLSNEFTGDTLDSTGHGIIRCVIPRMPLRDGRYYLNVDLRERGMLQEKIFNTTYFEVLPTSFFKAADPQEGLFLLDHRWSAAPAAS